MRVEGRYGDRQIVIGTLPSDRAGDPSGAVRPISAELHVPIHGGDKSERMI